MDGDGQGATARSHLRILDFIATPTILAPCTLFVGCTYATSAKATIAIAVHQQQLLDRCRWRQHNSLVEQHLFHVLQLRTPKFFLNAHHTAKEVQRDVVTVEVRWLVGARAIRGYQTTPCRSSLKYNRRNSSPSAAMLQRRAGTVEVRWPAIVCPHRSVLVRRSTFHKHGVWAFTVNAAKP